MIEVIGHKIDEPQKSWELFRNNICDNYIYENCNFCRNMEKNINMYFYLANIGGTVHKLYVCKNCAHNKNQAIMWFQSYINKEVRRLESLRGEKQVNNSFMKVVESLKPVKEEKMSLKEFLAEEKKVLQAQLEKFEKLGTKVETLPQHVKEHLELRKTLIVNCLNAIQALEDNEETESIIKEIFQQ